MQSGESETSGEVMKKPGCFESERAKGGDDESTRGRRRIKNLVGAMKRGRHGESNRESPEPAR